MRFSGPFDAVRVPATPELLRDILSRALCLLLTVGPGTVLGEASLRVEPGTAIAGVFSALDPRQTELNVGSTEIEVLSTEENWRLWMTVLEPLRRVSDGLELPMERFARLFPDIPHAILSFQPYEFRQGPAGPDSHIEVHDWQVFQEALVTYIEEADPPGSYGTTVRFELLNEGGAPLTDPAEMTIEFVVAACATVDLLEPEISIPVGFEGTEQGHGESFLIPVEVRANTSWLLELRGAQEYLDGEWAQMPLEMLSARTEVGLDDGWVTYMPMWTPLSVLRRPVASGAAPLPFSLNKAVVPLRLAGDVPIAIPSGSYGVDIEVIVVAPWEEEKLPRWEPVSVGPPYSDWPRRR